MMLSGLFPPLRRVHSFLALRLGLGSLALGCLVWTLFSLPLTFVLLLPQYQPIEHDANRPI